MYLSMQQARLSIARPCRFIARRRYPASLASRQLHQSRTWLSSPSPNPPTAGASTSENVFDELPSSNAEGATATSNDSEATVHSERSARSDAKPYGSAVRRAMRNRKLAQQPSPPAATVPNWFHERNTVVHSAEDHAAAYSLRQVRIAKSGSESKDTTKENLALGGDGGSSSSPSNPPGAENRYAVAEATWDELRASVNAGLRLPPAKYAKEPSVKKSHLVLQYPGTDGILFLDAVVKRLAHELSTDLVTMNAQDIAQLFSEQDLTDVGVTSPIRSLGYEVYRPSAPTAWPEVEDTEGDGEDGASDLSDSSRGIPGEIASPQFITIENGKDSTDFPMPNWLRLKSLVASINGQPDQDPETAASHFSGHRLENRWTRLVNELLSSSGAPVQPTSNEPTNPSEVNAAKPASFRDVIVHIQDYRDIQSTREGSKFISMLQRVIQDRRRDGAKIVLIGTTSQDVHPSRLPDGLRLLQNVFDDHFSKTLVVTPAMGLKDAAKTFAEDRKKRTIDINTRHLQNMLRFRLNEQASPVEDDIFGGRAWPLDPATIKESGIEDRYWTYNQVHWIATLALGCAEVNEPFGFKHIRRGIELMAQGDRVTHEWLQDKSPKSKESGSDDNREQLLSSLRKTCNTHEKKLLNGVVDARSIRTTFEDVRAPSETIDALKTLTSLSLIRPEAFTYGVLATDKIPGLLLYGPPGTGKTLLAKAVARESGATVLEVSGSDVYDMYVGEGEKNVKAIFTLAKKLSPCVVFIDEADAIFGSRTGASSRTSHRELINQFLREWDGMNDLSAFIMVATNRPFDLDDAVLRRLPRRLLVDLPTEEDRLAILKIHLKDEQLDSSVDLAELARRTALYSGSDLKNLSVAAALACVREENEAAAVARRQGSTEPYQYPERRTLMPAHFERGIGEISASISEDMSSLSAIRKFDEQYGDRKGRRQKSPGWGFIPAPSEEATADAARVRT